MKLFVLFILALLSSLMVCGQQEERIMFYNVENLFDTKNDPLTQDDDFTPQGKKHWNKERYMLKIRHLADAVKAVGGARWPVVVGLAEIENRNVLRDFTTKTLLSDGEYGIVHRDGPDARGIDVALLYRQKEMQLVETDFLRIHFSEDTSIRTREVLYAKTVFRKDTLHFFVCHFPSMIGGEKKSEWKRCKVASVVRHKVDSLLMKNLEAKIVIMGDLNGKSNTQAQREVLKAMDVKGKVKAGELYHTGSYLLKKSEIGTYRYQGNWQTIDQILVSSGLLNGKKGIQMERQMKVGAEDFLLEEDKTYFGKKPYPSYKGLRYVGGYSDHLPIYITLYELGKR